MELLIKKLDSTLLSAFLDFFDNIAFTDNPDWSRCYCNYFHFTGSTSEWLKQSKNQNRQSAIETIERNEKPGFLAFINEKPVAWINAGPKIKYPLLFSSNPIYQENSDEIIAIVCFVIAPGYRKKGIATHLLNYVCELYSNKIIEAYPSLESEVTGDAKHYHGTLSMYEKAGFKPYRKEGNMTVVRKNF